MDQILIFGNKNTVPGDVSAFNPNGYRIGTPAMTTRGANEKDFIKIIEFIDRTIEIIPEITK